MSQCSFQLSFSMGKSPVERHWKHRYLMKKKLRVLEWAAFYVTLMWCFHNKWWHDPSRHAGIHSQVQSVVCIQRIQEFGEKRHRYEHRYVLPQHTYDHNCRPKICYLLFNSLLAFGLSRIQLGEECQQVSQCSPVSCCFSTQKSNIISMKWKKVGL